MKRIAHWLFSSDWGICLLVAVSFAVMVVCNALYNE